MRRARHAATCALHDEIGLLGRVFRTYRFGFEPACSIGALTVRLAPRCEPLFAIDISPSAVARTKARCAAFPHVTVRHGRLPADLAADRVDLVVLSEVGYYFESAALAAIVDRIVVQMVYGGRLVACHWTGTSPDHVLSGAQVHSVIDAHPELGLLQAHGYNRYRLATYERRSRVR